MLIAHLSDLHITVRDALVQNGAVDTAAALTAAIDHIRRLPVTPDALVITGDLTERGEPAEYDNLVRLLAPLDIPLLACPGNHDDPAALRAALARLPRFGAEWAKYGTHDQVQDLGALRLVGLDSTVPGAPHGEIRDQQLAWLDSRLGEAAFIGVPVVLFLHHPPFHTGIVHMDQMALLDAEGLGTVLDRHQGRVIRLLCGHVHRHITTQWRGVPAVIAPSPAHAVTLDLDPHAPATFTLEPPALLLHHWNARDWTMVSHAVHIGVFGAPQVFV
jgi:3',5'-cyclic AMP phosphodiesterase CpdA